ncbi:MAG: ABC transporter ATP-binding protein [Desulfobacterales bacterium]|jgi:zinc transport system ATP-binding protein
MNDIIIDIRNLCFSFNEYPILEDVNLDVQKGDFLAMIGPNGGGKTTLLRLMLGLLKPTQGSIRIFAATPSEASHRIGYVPQDVHINMQFPISALDVVLMGKLKPGRGWSRYSRQDRIHAREALDKLEMGEFCERRIGELSGGQIQRVLIARALVTEPEILFLDEPTASIDTKGQRGFYNLLKQLNETITIVIVSHDLMVLSGYVKSVACVNQHLHYHNQAEVTGEMIETMYHCSVEETCPVELIAHGLPHRVLMNHEDD